MSFKLENSFEERRKESERVLKKYPDRIPVICEKARTSKIKECLTKKYLLPKDLQIGMLSFVIKKRLNMDPETAIFILINGKMVSNTKAEEIYQREKDKDGFLYAVYSEENVFG